MGKSSGADAEMLLSMFTLFGSTLVTRRHKGIGGEGYKGYLAENPAFAASFVEVSTPAVVANPALASAMVQGTVAVIVRAQSPRKVVIMSQLGQRVVMRSRTQRVRVVIFLTTFDNIAIFYQVKF